MRAMRAILVTVLAGVIVVGCGSSRPKTVAPRGGPYSYTMPAGFIAAKPEFPGTDPPFLTTSVSKHETPDSGTLIAFEVPTRRAVAPGRLLAEFDRIEQQFYRGRGATITPATHVRMAGHDALCWQIGHFRNPYNGLVDGDSCAIAGRHLVTQTCTWKPKARADIERGCRALRRTLRVY
jgi:hypothetical protein